MTAPAQGTSVALLGDGAARDVASALRAAATALRLHHSTLQERLTHTRRLLDWDIREPQGRLRLQVALALRRLHRNQPQ